MNPYQNLSSSQFWRTAISDREPQTIDGLWRPKFQISRNDRFATYGSCFAQHISAALVRNQFDWVNAEKHPFGMSESTLKLYNYSVFSSRTQNIYTTTMLNQWLTWAMEGQQHVAECWESQGRYYDPFRPTLEPEGFASPAEVVQSRQNTAACLRNSISEATVLIFTLGLTERWINKTHGYEYSVCPGSKYGSFDVNEHIFSNLTYSEVSNSLVAATEKIKDINENIKIILTVSPVPLVATHENRHILVSNMESKSILRAVAAQLVRDFEFVDYFPSYEMIASAPFKGAFYAGNMRKVTEQGIDFVMRQFFSSIGADNSQHRHDLQDVTSREMQQSYNESICEEELLEAFSR